MGVKSEANEPGFDDWSWWMYRPPSCKEAQESMGTGYEESTLSTPSMRIRLPKNLRYLILENGTIAWWQLEIRGDGNQTRSFM